MQERFRRRLADAGRAVDSAAALVDHDKIVTAQTALIFSAGGDQKPKWLARDYSRIVAAGTDRPPAQMKFAANGPKRLDGRGNGFAGGGHIPMQINQANGKLQ